MIYVAVSGGVDSMYLLHKLHERGIPFTIINYNYGDSFSNEVEDLLREVSKSLNAPLILSSQSDLIKEVNNKQNKEDYWRRSRYNFFSSVLKEEDILLVGHHKTDQLVSWINSRLKNSSRCFIPLVGFYKGMKLMRPLYLLTKEEIKREVEFLGIPYIEDPENNHGNRSKVERLLPLLHEAISQMEGAFNNQYKEWVERFINKLDSEERDMILKLT